MAQVLTEKLIGGEWRVAHVDADLMYGEALDIAHERWLTESTPTKRFRVLFDNGEGRPTDVFEMDAETMKAVGRS